MKWLAIAIVAILIFPGCIEKEKHGGLKVILPFESFPAKYTCDGSNVSPEIELEGINESVKTIVIVVVDSDAKNFVHWLIWNIKANHPDMVIPENISKEGIIDIPFYAIQGRNDFGKIGYGGPCPPPGRLHHYHFKVYGLDSQINLHPGASLKELQKAMRGHIVQYGETVATYSR